LMSDSSEGPGGFAPWTRLARFGLGASDPRAVAAWTPIARDGHGARWTLIALALLLMLAACVPPASSPAGSGSQIVTPQPLGTEVVSNAATGVPIGRKPYDQQFIDQMVPHHELEIEMARVAQARAQHQELRDLATEIVDLNSELIGEMQIFRQTWFGSSRTPPISSTAAVDALNAAPEPFDKAFIDAMLPLQQLAIEEAKTALLEAGEQGILDLAGEMLGERSRFVLLMEGWRSEW
jgi:uncharacterized protein (DUF305 family)